MKKFCISTDTFEEQREIEKILNDTGIEYIIYTAPTTLKNRLGRKIHESLDFLGFLKRNNFHAIIGGPTLRNRVANIIGQQKYISYLRSLHPSPEKLTSLSDQIFSFLKKFSPKANLLNPYHADLCITNSRINEKFLETRGIDSHKIINIGLPILEYNLPPKKFSTNASVTIIYITQAFREHNNTQADTEQREIIKHIHKTLNERNLTLTIRKHPRDETNYNELLKGNYTINSLSAQEFIKTIPKNTLIITPFSTLSFEINKNNTKKLFISIKSIPSYDQALDKCGIPYTPWEEIDWKTIEKYLSSPPIDSHSIFSDYKPELLKRKLDLT